jgi:hypothetical protein
VRGAGELEFDPCSALRAPEPAVRRASYFFNVRPAGAGSIRARRYAPESEGGLGVLLKPVAWGCVSASGSDANEIMRACGPRASFVRRFAGSLRWQSGCDLDRFPRALRRAWRILIRAMRASTPTQLKFHEAAGPFNPRRTSSTD